MINWKKQEKAVKLAEQLSKRRKYTVKQILRKRRYSHSRKTE